LIEASPPTGTAFRDRLAARNRPGNWLRAACLLVTLPLLAACASAESPAPTVIVISWDGVRHDYPARAEFPALQRMARQGARALRLAPVFPSSTFPSHVSLATGAPTEVHGIVDNRFRDRERGLYDYSNDASWMLAEPIWVAAERQGIRSAVFFWVGSETAWQGVAASYRMTPFDPKVGEAKKVEQILAWLDLPTAERPQLILSWWHGADGAGHRHGPDDEAVVRALREQDRQLGKLFRGLDERDAWATTTVLLVSDHGMTRITTPIYLEALLEAADIPAETLRSSAVSHVFLDHPADRSRALEALAHQEGFHAYPGDALPASLQLGPPARLGDLVVVAEPPYAFRSGILETIADGLGLNRGAHGYHPRQLDMAGIFLALGRGVSPGEALEEVSSLDVAPSVARLLGIDPPRHARGRPIPALGGAPARP